MPHSLPAVRTVDHGCFIQLSVDTGDRRQVEDRAPSHRLPYTDQQICNCPVPFLIQERNSFGDHSQVRQQDIHQTGVRTKHCHGYASDDSPGKEMWQIQDRL